MTDVLKALPGILLTVCCWGAYGSLLHKGQDLLSGNRLKPLICVGLAYLLIAIILPVILLAVQGKLGGDWSFSGISWSLTAGSAGAFGALGIILALTAGGKPIYVMPLVFGCAPIVNVVFSMWFAGISWKNVSPVFISGLMLVSVGAAMVLIFKPSPTKAAHAPAAHSTETEEHDAHNEATGAATEPAADSKN